MRDGSTSTQRIAAPAIVAASGCAPPMPPRPAVRIVRPGERRLAKVLLRRGRERLVGALEDPLRADVDPRPGRHLTEHRQPLRLEPAELVPGRPARHEQRVRDQHARRLRRRPEDARRACRTGRAGSRRRRAPAVRGRFPSVRRASAPRAPSLRRPRGLPAVRRLRASRLLSSIRSGASVAHDFAFSVDPRGARIAERSPQSASTVASIDGVTVIAGRRRAARAASSGSGRSSTRSRPRRR